MLRRLGAGDADHPLVVLGEEDRARLDVAARVRPLLVPRLRLAGRVRHLGLELLPELAEDGLVGEGRAADPHGVRAPREEVVGREVLEGGEPGADGLHVLSVEPRDRLLQRQVARRPRGRPREVARQEPLRRPRAEAAPGDDRRPHLVVGQRGERVEVEVGAGEVEHVRGLGAREAEREEVVLRGVRRRARAGGRRRRASPARRSARRSGCGSRAPRRARPAARRSRRRAPPTGRARAAGRKPASRGTSVARTGSSAAKA